ncbi:hypothetical protein [Hymenobacter fodinae]|uniref:Uncharacterized protein n=1 Tax=Hymenobacter fodinae TaxID=2510796 RepID=A0A4Z0P7B9_9BACT|nr:hypothetical protein [Hymenobacter fodinae]TGE08272.1 hypothetical protein EU556_11155 [Hymenobacter fodinae]
MQSSIVRREYIRHNQKHVAYLQQYYSQYTIDELAAQLQLPAAKLKALARRAGIRKRAPNKQKTLISSTSTAVA